MVKLSIIIPYFETYELTCKLLDRLIPQLTEEVEMLVIDDGCFEERLDNYKGIQVLHQNNKGVAKTRNIGRNISSGKYVAFIDCDDMVSKDYISTLLNAIDNTDTDVINFDWQDIKSGEIWKRPVNYAPWKAIYKKKTMPRFREDMPYGSEDVPFQEEIMSGKYTITYLDKVLYFYNSHRVGSLIWKKTHREEESHD